MEDEKQECSHQSLPIGAELHNDTITKENQMVDLGRNDLGSVDNLINKPVQSGYAILGGVSEGVDGGDDVSGVCEQAGLKENVDLMVSLEGADVRLQFNHIAENMGEGSFVGAENMYKPVDISNVISDEVLLEGVDASVRFEHGSENKREGVHVSGVCEQAVSDDNADLKASLEGADVRLRFECMSENQVGGGHVSVDNPIDEPVQINNVISDVAFSERVDGSLKFERGSENLGEGAHESGRCDIMGLCENSELKSVSEGMGASLRYEHMSLNQGEHAHVSMRCELPGSKEDTDFNAKNDNAKLEQNEESKDDTNYSSMMEGEKISLTEQVENLQSDMLKSCGTIEGKCGVTDAQANVVKQFAPPPETSGEKKLIVVVLAVPADSREKPRPGRKSKAASKKMESPQQVSAGTRVLRSRSKVNHEDAKENHEDAEPSADLATRKGSTEKRGRKKGKGKDGNFGDEFSKMRKHLKYLLHRIKYEQNLLDAYSSEGWRGQSIEKIRPEKELQRAKADINRSKLKIRDLFQRLDSMSAEGKFPDSLYDSDGLIDSEDIFCAKCGSKDLPLGNDILLCDGICERGFHQYCLNPPLPTEEIPPGDEGWLCPACDCKVDCYNLLNDSHGTKLTIEDSWEKVFPEAVAAMAGNELDDIMGLPSDDSEDNEYNPDGADDNASVEENESSTDKSGSDESDSSDFSSASEDLGAIAGAEKNLGLPSDDTEDDDFDPNAANIDEDGVEMGSSGSDFTSASEDLGAVADGGTSDQGEPPLPLELEQNLDESSPVTGKRCADRLDYKKLYDETFGNAASDSSDDEEWTDMLPTRKRKNSTEKTSCASASVDGTCGSDAPRRRGRPKANRQVTNGSLAQQQESSQKVANGSPAQRQESSQKTTSAGSSKRRPPYNKLGESVTKRLYESFRENQYPDRETKEKLANEVGLTFHRVDKWFGNARWSLHHHPFRVEAVMNRVMSRTTPHNVACNGGETTVAVESAALPECGSADTSTKKLTPRRSRKITEGDQSMLQNSFAENSKEGIMGDPLQAPENTQGRVQRKRRKSGA